MDIARVVFVTGGMLVIWGALGATFVPEGFWMKAMGIQVVVGFGIIASLLLVAITKD